MLQLADRRNQGHEHYRATSRKACTRKNSANEGDSLRTAITRAKIENVIRNLFATTSQNPSPEYYMTKEQLAAALNVPSTRMIDELVRRRKIPHIKMGHRTVRFVINRVREALDRYEVRAVR